MLCNMLGSRIGPAGLARMAEEPDRGGLTPLDIAAERSRQPYYSQQQRANSAQCYAALLRAGAQVGLHDQASCLPDIAQLLVADADLDGAEIVLCAALADATRSARAGSNALKLELGCDLGRLLIKRGDRNGGEAVMREALRAGRTTLAFSSTAAIAADEEPVLAAAAHLADALVAARSRVGAGSDAALNEAAALAEEALASPRASGGHPRSWELIALRARGRVRFACGDLAGAASDLRQALRGLRRLDSRLSGGSGASEARCTARELASVLRAAGDAVGAAGAEAAALA